MREWNHEGQVWGGRDDLRGSGPTSDVALRDGATHDGWRSVLTVRPSTLLRGWGLGMDVNEEGRESGGREQGKKGVVGNYVVC